MRLPLITLLDDAGALVALQPPEVRRRASPDPAGTAGTW
jgi:hypothetical protein